jgi:hypothetical protein
VLGGSEHYSDHREHIADSTVRPKYHERAHTQTAASDGSPAHDAVCVASSREGCVADWVGARGRGLVELIIFLKLSANFCYY